METKNFSATLTQLPNMLMWIRFHLDPLPLNRADEQKIELAVEEALVNIINYAYQQKPGQIKLTYTAAPSSFQLTIEDWGPPFNPTSINPVIEHKSLENRAIGGLGIPFIQRIMDQVQYKRENNANVLTLTRNLH